MQNESPLIAGEALQSLNQELEERVHQLTKDLREAEERLRLIRIERDETALSKSHEQLRLMIEQAPVGIAMLDRNMCYLAASLRWKEDFGREDQDLSGRSHYEVFQDIPERWKKVHQKALAGGIIKNDEDEWIQADGSKVWLRWAVHPWRDAYDEIGGIIMSAENITPRKQTEEQLRESERRLQAIVENLTEGLIIADFDGHLGQWNRAALEMHGFRNLSEATLQVSEMEKIFELATLEGRTLSSAERPLARILRGEALRNYEIRIRRKDSDWERIFKYNGNSLVEPDGKTIAILTITDITDRKKAEAEVRESEILFRTLFEKSAVGKLIIDYDEFKVEACNPAAAKMLGYTREELLELTIPDFEVTPSLIETFRHNEFILNDGNKQFQTLYRTKPGELRDVMVGCTNIRIKGKDFGYISVLDITDQKRTEEELQREHLRLEKIAVSSPSVIYSFRVSPEGHYSYPYVSAAFSDLFGVGQGEARQDARITDARVHPDDFPGLRQSILDSARNLSRWHYAWRVKHLSKGEICLEGYSAPVREADGSIVWHGILNDVTEQKQAEQALRNSEERLKLALATARMGVWEWDVRTNAVFWSPECYEILGSKDFDGTMAGFSKLIHPEDRDRIMQLVQQSIVDKVTYSAEFRALRPDGQERWLSNLGRAFYDQQGAPTCMIGIAQDITQRKLAEAELEQSLEQVRSLTIHLQDVREEERKRIARELHDELGQALAGLKFDLAWLENCLLPNDGPTMQLLQEKTQTMSKIIDATIQIGRKIATELRPRVLDDLGLVAALGWQARDFQKRTGIICEFIVRDADITLDTGRATAVFRICQETLTNILRHAQATAVTIHLQVKDNCLRLEIKDNGRGITEQEINRNVSLGLLGMKERLLPYGGKIDILGRAGKGTTITVLLPLAT